MLNTEKAMLYILCEEKDGIPALITIKNSETGEIKQGRIILNGDKVNISKSISSHIYDKFKRSAAKQENTQIDKSQNKIELMKKAIQKLLPEEQKAFQLFYGDKLKNG